MKGDAFILLASQWVIPGEVSEQVCRSAVSRAYYGAYHIARALLMKIGATFPKFENTHELIPRDLMNCGDDEAYEAGSMLGDLRDERNRADYKLDDSTVGSRAFAKIQVETAVEVQSLLSKCIQEPKLTRIRDGVRNYRETLKKTN